MTDSEKEQLREQLKIELQNGRILSRDRLGKGFICPKCGNGSGKHGDGIHFKRGGDLLTCFSCGVSFDVFEALGAQEGLSDFGEILARACQITGFTPSEGITAPKTHAEGPRSPKSVEGRIEDGIGQKRAQNAKKPPKKDYSVYIEECLLRNDGSYLRGRGISDELQFSHKIGIDPSYKGEGVERLVIPNLTSEGVCRSFVEILTDRTKEDPRHPKAKASDGERFLFNEDTLRDTKDPRPCFVVEGEIDALSLEEIGQRAVGLGGTGGKRRLVELVKGLTFPPVLILALDNDEAGRLAQYGKTDPSTGYQDPTDRGLLMELSELGFPVYEAKYTGERWKRQENPLKDVNDFLVEDRGAFEEWAQEQVQQTTASLDHEKESYLRESEEALLEFDLQNQKIAKPIPTGFRQLDKILGGGLRVGLTTLGAGTSFGKTALSMQIAESMVRNSGEDVLFFSLEMGKNELRARSLSRLTAELLKIPNYSVAPACSFSDVLNGSRLVNEAQIKTLGEARELYSSYCRGLRILESQGEFSVEDVRRAVARHKRLTGRTPVVFIDYLQILHPLNPRESEKQQTDRNILELRRIAREFEAVVVVLSSLNRAGYKKKPTLESFKESGGVEYGSDIVLMLSFELRDDLFIETIDEETGKKKRVYDYDRAKAESPRKMLLSLLKNRNGNPTGVVKVDSYSRYSLFTERGDSSQGPTA